MILTIGHSTRTADEFLVRLDALAALSAGTRPSDMSICRDTLIVLAAQNQVAVMCAEAKWWQCRPNCPAFPPEARKLPTKSPAGATFSIALPDPISYNRT